MNRPIPGRPNPLLGEWSSPFGLPPFGDIEPADFPPAFDAALAAHREEIAAIAGSSKPPDFANTIAALERSGALLRRVGGVFFNLARADTNAALQEIERDVAPALARHRNAVYLDQDLFRRVTAVAEGDARDLSAEEARVLERTHMLFRRHGAALPDTARARLSEIAERLAALGTRFAQNVLADEAAFGLVLDGEADLAGLPHWLRNAAAQAATERGLAGKQVITLSRSMIEPFLQTARRRDLREAAFRAWVSRGETGGDTDNRAIIAETLGLRAERARLLGHDSFAHYRLDDTMAKTPEAARDLLQSVWTPARERALRDAAKMQTLIAEEGGNFTLAPWDWRYYAQALRRTALGFDEGDAKPYLPLEGMIEAAFDVAGRLFGLVFEERPDLPRYHPDVRAWEVRNVAGRHLGVFLGDYFARPSKQSGAWMSTWRNQEKLAGEVRPIVANVTNFARGGAGVPALLSLEDARTLFHEFGHALHVLMSDVTYPMLSGTNVARDFVEFPSQLYEHWLDQPAVLERFARHWQTGEPMPEALIEKVRAARGFDQGFATVEYTASALVDLDLHLMAEPGGVDIGALEREALSRLGMPEAIVMRHRPPHFAHVFAGEGYAAGYYSYLWSEVLDADGFGAFEEAGDPFDQAVAKRLGDYIYSAGNLRDPAEAYEAFRGRAPSPEALLKKRGLAPASGEV